MRKLLILIFGVCLASGNVFAQKINADSMASIVRALQEHVKDNPSVFPLESSKGGVQPPGQGLRFIYFGYGERTYEHRFDFHPAMDAGYVPTEVGNVVNEQGETWEVRSPQSYLKKVYAIQKGELVSMRLISTGYKLILKHELETPYYDNDGKAYHHYYTCYRHLDSRSLGYLNDIAREFLGNADATYEDLFGKYIFEAGEQLALVGFTPDRNAVGLPRAHIDFSLNLFKDPDKGTNIRNYAVNPLLLFPPFEYTAPQGHESEKNQAPAYQFIVDESRIVAPGKNTDGSLVLKIHAGGWSDDDYSPTRYFALNGFDVVVTNDDKHLASFRVDRQRKLGYDTKSYDSMDNPNLSIPHFVAPLGEQKDVFRMNIVLPKVWFEEHGYDWSKDGSVSIAISSIWDAYLEGHNHALTIALPAR